MALIYCRTCQRQIDSSAKVCPHCGKRRTTGCALIAAIFIGAFVLMTMTMFFFAKLADRDGITATPKTPTPAAAPLATPAPAAAPVQPTVAVAPVAPPPPEPNWKYQIQQDAIDGGMYFTTATSVNTLNLDFPYQGEQNAYLTVREINGKQEVIVQIERGQILCRSYDTCTIPVKFDDGAVQNFEGVGPADNSSISVFLNGEKRFLSQLKTAHKVYLKIPLFQSGEPTMEFNVEGFQGAREPQVAAPQAPMPPAAAPLNKENP